MGTLLILPFVYNASHRVSRLMDVLLTSLLAGHDTGLRIPTTVNDIRKGRGEMEKRETPIKLFLI